MANPLLVLGVSDAAVGLLATKLRAQGHWSGAENPGTFTPELEQAVEYFQMTHLGPNGKPLSVDGAVGPDTWWALDNASGAPQRSEIKATIPQGVQPLRTKLLGVALAEHAKNVQEQPNGSNRGPEVDKYLPDAFRKPGAEGPPWCCFFYSWVANQALGQWPLGRRVGGCAEARGIAGGLKIWVPKHLAAAQRRPLPGDAFVMDKGAGHGHIGYVLRVSADGAQINTVEGNCGNRVKLGLRELADPQIVGFIDNVPSESNAEFERGIVNAQKVGADVTR